MVWWTEGSSAVEPSCLLVERPAAAAHVRGPARRGLDGSISGGRFPPSSTTNRSPTTRSATRRAMRRRSGSGRRPRATSGNVRQINQDSFLELPESGLWVVADGIGGHSDGEVASRMVCDALADFQQVGTLRRHGGRGVRPAAGGQRSAGTDGGPFADRRDRCGSTVVALLVRGSQCAVLWAGDSRVVPLAIRPARSDDARSQRRRGGSHGPAQCDHARRRRAGRRWSWTCCRDQVRPGDRYLLCSDGLTRRRPRRRDRRLHGGGRHRGGRRRRSSRPRWPAARRTTSPRSSSRPARAAAAFDGLSAEKR